MDREKIHVVFFPWLAFGHMIPFLEVAKKIAIRNHKVTYISTPKNVDRLLQNDAVAQNSTIEFVRLPLPHQEGLPLHAESTTDLQFHEVPFLKRASDLLKENLAEFLKSSKPDWVVYDFNPYWLPPILNELGISGAFFNIISSWTLCAFGSSSDAFINGSDRKTIEDFVSPPKWVPFSTDLCFRGYEAKRMLLGVQDTMSDVSDGYRAGMGLKGCNLIVSRSCNELDGEWLKLLGDLHKKPTSPVGLLPPSSDLELHNPERANSWSKISNWLDKWDKGLVLYVALGSEAPLVQEVVSELAHGIELSNVPFLWAFKAPKSIKLPLGFEERTKGKGIVWTEWVPQVKILAHEAIGGFLTHCGWGSVLEGLEFGRPLVMLPFVLDQGLNSTLLVKKGVGIEVPRNDEDGSFTKESVCESIIKVMAKDSDNIYSKNAKKWGQIVGDQKLHEDYVDGFIQSLRAHKQVICD